MSKLFETTVHGERSNIRKEIRKDTTPGQYSKRERIAQAIDIKTKQIIQSEAQRGKEVTATKAREIAVKIAEHRDKRFG